MLKSDKHLPRHLYELEKCEAEYWQKLYAPAPGLSPSIKGIGGGIACCLPEIDILAMNRVIGWGWHQRDLTSQLTDIIEYYRTQKSRRFFIQLSPFIPQSENLKKLLYRQGFKLYNHWSKLCRPAEDYNPDIHTFFQIKTISRASSEEYGKIITQCFQWGNPGLKDWLAESVGKPGYTHYLVYQEGEAVAAGALHLSGHYGSMAFAATLPEFQGMGAQSLLLHQRIRDAQSSGAKYLVSETAIDSDDRPVKSYRNMQKFGFEKVYDRENWIYEF